VVCLPRCVGPPAATGPQLWPWPGQSNGSPRRTGSLWVSASTRATVMVATGVLPGGRVLSRSSPSTPASALRICQRHTAPARRAGAPRHPQHRQAVRRVGCASAGGSDRQCDRRQTGAILRADGDADFLGHFRKIAHPGRVAFPSVLQRFLNRKCLDVLDRLSMLAKSYTTCICSGCLCRARVSELVVVNKQEDR
jgi:hypothetical protein